MYLTEEEAKKKTCIVGRQASVIVGPIVSLIMASKAKAEREQEVSEWTSKFTACIASECMMWIWEPKIPIVENESIKYEETGRGGCGLVRR